MPAHRKYEDSLYDFSNTQGALAEHHLLLGDFRSFTPTEHEEGDGEYGGLAAGATGDWGWKPQLPFVPFTGITQRARERASYGCEQAQGIPRATTRVTSDGRIAQYNIPPEKQARKWRTGDMPARKNRDGEYIIPSAMKPIWDQINSRAAT